MKPSFLSVNGVASFVVCVGSGGRIRHFAGDLYEPLDVASPTTATLRSVWVNSPLDAWAVGEKGTILHWDGTAWSAVLLAAATDDLLSVWSCEGEAWIGGVHRLIAHRPGGIGGMLVSAAHTIRHIWGTGPDDVFYLCDDGLVLHGSTRACQIISTPEMQGERYHAIGGGTGEDDVYLVGESGTITRWDGDQWLDVEFPTYDDLFGVAVDGPDLWVVSRLGELWHHDGMRWEVAASVPFGILRSVAVIDGSVWAVGLSGVVLQHRPCDGGEKE